MASIKEIESQTIMIIFIIFIKSYEFSAFL